ASYALNLLAGASDADDGETATLSVASVSYAVDGGLASSTAEQAADLPAHALSVDRTNAAFNHLAAGQTTSIVVSYDVKDAQGATVAQTETITITGTTDAPVIYTQSLHDALPIYASYALNLLAGASDADDGETATLSVASVSYAVDGGLAS